MLKQVLYFTIYLSILASQTNVFGVSPNHSTKTNNSCFLDFFSSKPSTKELQKEIIDLRWEIEKLKEQQKELLTTINSTKANFALCNNEQKREINALGEIQRIMNQYGNNPDGLSALHYAIKIGDIYAVNLLLENGVNANSSNMDFYSQKPNSAIPPISALSRAAICNNFEIAKLLLSYGADVNFVPNEKDGNCCYPITYASEYSTTDLVTLLIENGALLDKSHPNSTETSLHTACRAGNYEAVIALVNGGAKINGNVPLNSHPNQWQYDTPLDVAARSLTYKANSQNLELVKFLVDNGARRRDHNRQVDCSVIKGYLQSVGQ